MPLRSFAPLLLIGIVACSTAPEPSASVLDSAGIAIVTNDEPLGRTAPGMVPRWRTGGSVADDAGGFLHVTALTARSDGVMLVASSGTAQIVAIGVDGGERWRFGRKGDGPGEFRGELSLAAIGDTAFVYDFTSHRLITIAPDGTLARELPIAIADPNLELTGALADGNLVFSSRHLEKMKPGLNRDSTVYLSVRRDGTRAGELGWGRTGVVDFVMGDFGPQLDDQALGPVGSAAFAPWGFAQTTGEAAEIAMRDVSGRISRLVRWHQPLVPIEDSERATFAADKLAAVRSVSRRAETQFWLDHAAFPPSMPVSVALAVAGDGRMLVADYCAESATECRWREFDADGRWTRMLTIPAHSTRAVMVGTLLVLLVADQDGIEQVVAFDLAGP